jgi:hypothetical protein
VHQHPPKRWGTDWGTIPFKGGVQIKICAFGAENMALTDAAIRARKPAAKPY